jgi:hypothetical protein
MIDTGSIKTGNTKGDAEMNKTTNITTIIEERNARIESKNAKIEKIAAQYRKLQDMMTCRQVSNAIDACIRELVILTGFDKYQVTAIYKVRG